MRETEACAQSLVFFVRDDVLIHRTLPERRGQKGRGGQSNFSFLSIPRRQVANWWCFFFSFSRRNPALTMRCYSRRSLKTRNRFNSKPNRGLLRRLGRRFEHLTMASDHHGTAGYFIRRRFLHGDDDVPARLPKQTTRREV